MNIRKTKNFCTIGLILLMTFSAFAATVSIAGAHTPHMEYPHLRICYSFA